MKFVNEQLGSSKEVTVEGRETGSLTDISYLGVPDDVGRLEVFF